MHLNRYITQRATLYIHILPVNNPPKMTIPAKVSMTFSDYGLEDVDAKESKLDIMDVSVRVKNASHTEEDVLSSTVVSLDSTAGLYFGGVDGLGQGMGDTQMRFKGSLADAQRAISSFTMEVTSESTSNDTITIGVSDTGGTGLGGAKTANYEMDLSLRVGSIPTITSMSLSGAQIGAGGTLRIVGANFMTTEVRKRARKRVREITNALARDSPSPNSPPPPPPPTPTPTTHTHTTTSQRPHAPTADMQLRCQQHLEDGKGNRTRPRDAYVLDPYNYHCRRDGLVLPRVGGWLPK